jgi:hypothetical protein
MLVQLQNILPTENKVNIFYVFVVAAIAVCIIIIIIIISSSSSSIIIIIIIISCHRFSFFPGTSPLEPVVNPTTQASSLSL